MKMFIAKTMFFILPFIIIAILMEILLRDIPNDYMFKKQYLDKHSFEIETLILGSSHSFYGFDPKYFSTNTFNASHILQSLNYDYKILKKYKDQFKSLNTIVIPISYFTLFGKLEAGSESWRVKNYTIYYGLNSSKSLQNYSEVLSNRVNVNIKRLFSYYIEGKSAVSCSELGWGTDYNSKNAQDLLKTGKSAAQQHTKDYIKTEKYQEIFKENISIINSIIDWCKENDVKVLFLTPPAYETYRQNLNQEQLNLTIKTISEICLSNSNCEYVNLLSDTNFVAIDFYDADHLSEYGAKKLSELVNQRIIEWK